MMNAERGMRNAERGSRNAEQQSGGRPACSAFRVPRSALVWETLKEKYFLGFAWMSDSSWRSWIMVSVVSRYSVESDTSRPSVPLRLEMRDITLSADTSTRTRLSWFLCAASSRSRKSWDAERKFALVVAELLRIVASWPWFVAESTRPSVVWKLVAALAS